MEPIEFDVSYGWLEYLSITRELVVPYVNDDRRKKGKSEVTTNDRILRITHGLFTTPIFLYKVLRVGRCKFSIGETEIVRVSKDGTLKCSWTDVVEVKRLALAYLVMKGDGAMPLPYRCFSSEQRSRFDDLLRRLGK